MKRFATISGLRESRNGIGESEKRVSGRMGKLRSTAHTSPEPTKSDQLGQLLRGGITNQAMVAHFHNRDGSDPFRQQHPWLESYVKCFQGKAHLLLQGLQPGENDGTERTAKEAVKIHNNGRAGRICMRRRDGSEFIHDPPIAEKAGAVGAEIKE